MRKRNNKLIYLIGGLLLLIVLILGILVITNKDNNNLNNDNKNTIIKEDTKNNLKDIYKDFIDNKKYLDDIEEESTTNGVSYAYYDLDKDGTEELIIYLVDESGDFGTNLFYTYQDNEIKYIDKIYHYGNLNYNEEERSIVYTEVRPSLVYGSSYGFYKLDSNKFVLNKSLSTVIEDNNSKYYIDDIEITEEEYNMYFENNINFDYTNIQ